jgi:dienelactone hydrolase
MARTGKGARQLVEQLSRPGDAEVLRGELALIGLPGLVFTPASGRRLPAVALGHGWMQPARRYANLLRHLASWGFVALAPDTQRGPLASAQALAGDLSTALDVATGVRLGAGQISVDPERLALAGHGTGGGAAVLAAAHDRRPRAVVLLAPSQTHPSAATAAESVSCPCLMLVAERDRVAPAIAHAEPIATSWAGPITARTLRKASHLGFLEGRYWTDVLVDGKPERTTQRLTLALTTAFLLKHLTGTTDYDALLDTDLRAAPLLPVAKPVPVPVPR